MSEQTGKRVDTISDGGAPPYGDYVNQNIQDNAYKLGWDEVAVPDNGRTRDGAGGQPVAEPEPPGRAGVPMRGNSPAWSPDGSAERAEGR